MAIDTLIPNIEERNVFYTLERNANPSSARIAEILAKAKEGNGLHNDEIAALCRITGQRDVDELLSAARTVKEHIYGKRLVLFAPLYVSNYCQNECLYCAFRAHNRSITRRALSQKEIRRETETLLKQGHKRVLLVAGEAYPRNDFKYVLDSIASVYSATDGNSRIRRVNVNIAPCTIEQFVLLRQAGIGTYQLFQETYHRPTYYEMHLSGQKRDYDWRVGAMHRAMNAGINDVGIGALFGLYDWKFELMAMMNHIRSLEQSYGVGPHTISVPRLEPATGSTVAATAPCPVSDGDFKKIIAILRLAVPYTGIILSTRENTAMRKECLALGVSQISAGSRTDPGGYANKELSEVDGQFSLGDHRSLDEVIYDTASMGYIPSFCTGCYRLGRTGADFMDLAKPGEIKEHCDPNAVSTFLEYLIDYATPQTRRVGEELIAKSADTMTATARCRTLAMANRVREGNRDVLC